MADGEDDRDELVADCRVRTATELLAHRWDPVVLAALRPGPRRRRALREAIGGISDKALTDALRRLARAGLIVRAAYAEAPPRVEYALAPLGASLVDGPLEALGRWMVEHGDELLAARERSGSGASDEAGAASTSYEAGAASTAAERRGQPPAVPASGWLGDGLLRERRCAPAGG